MKAHIAPEERPHRRAVPRLALLFGALLLICGVVSVFLTANDGGAAALLWTGTILIGISLLGDRVDGFEAAGVKISLRASAERALREAREAEEAGDVDRAGELRTRAVALLAAAQDLSERYDETRDRESVGIGRTIGLEKIAREARALAYKPETTVSGLNLLFNAGSPGNRVTALAIMDERPQLAAPSLITDALTSPRSAFEMYAALGAARSYLASGLAPEAARQSILTVVRTQLEVGRLGAPDSDRVQMAREILRHFSSGE